MSDSSIQVGAEIWLKRNGVKMTKLDIVTDSAPQVSCNSDAEIKMRLTCSVSGKFEIDYSNDTLVPVINIGENQFQIGEFYVTQDTIKNRDGLEIHNLTGLDLCYSAKKRKIEERLYFATGSLYTAAISQILVQGGITNFIITPSTLAFATDREDWEPGTPYIEIANELLSEMNYNSLYTGLDGVVIVSPYVVPSTATVTKTYYNNEVSSMLLTGHELEIDAFDHPNVFHYICENPEMEESMHVVSANEDAANMFSVQSQGRVPVYVKVDNSPNLAALQATADKARLNSMIAVDNIQFSTGLNPTHNPYEILSVRKDDFFGVVAETEWDIELAAGGTMRHVGKRVRYS